MTNREQGLKVFGLFYKWQKSFYGIKVTYSFDQFLNFYGRKKELYLENIGSMIKDAEVSDSRLDAAMRAMALASKGKVMSNPIQISNYIQSQDIQINWVDAASFVVVESAKDVLKGAQSVGDSILVTGKILNFFLPVIIIGGLFLFLNHKSGGAIMKGIRK